MTAQPTEPATLLKRAPGTPKRGRVKTLAGVCRRRRQVGKRVGRVERRRRVGRQASGAGRFRDDRGGAVSLWVVLMVPVSAFAAVVAMAGPQRLAAESSVQEAADDLAVFAVAWRDGHQRPDGSLSLFFFPPECATAEQANINQLRGDIALLLQQQAPSITTERDELHRLMGEFNLPLPGTPATDANNLDVQFGEFEGQLREWKDSCEALRDALWRDLGYLGVNFDSARGLYSDSLAESPDVVWECSNPLIIDPALCKSPETWGPTSATQHLALPCRTAETTVVRDAVHVALAADWQDAGWAAAQVWPDGMPMAAEATGRLSQHDTASGDIIGCTNQLTTVDPQGRPAWSGTNTQPDSRKLVQSVGRTTLSD